MRGKKARILRKEFRSTQFAQLPTFSETNVHNKEFVVGKQFNLILQEVSRCLLTTGGAL